MSNGNTHPDLSAVPLATVASPMTSEVLMAPMATLPGIALPRFSAFKNRDICTFCVNMQCYLMLFQLTDKQSMIIMAMHLHSVTGKWFNSKYLPGCDPITAKSVLDKLYFHFHNLVQKDSVTNYSCVFLKLMDILNIADSSQVIFQFINRLKHGTRSQLAMAEIHTVQDAILAANKYDSTMFTGSRFLNPYNKQYDDLFMNVNMIQPKSGKQVSLTGYKKFVKKYT